MTSNPSSIPMHRRLISYLKRKILHLLEIPEYHSLDIDALIIEESDEPISIPSMGTLPEQKPIDLVSPNCNWSLPLEVRKERRRVASTRPIQTHSIIDLPPIRIEDATTSNIYDFFKGRCLSCSRPSPVINCAACRNWQRHNQLHYGVSILFGTGIAILFWWFTHDYQITLVIGLFGIMFATLCYQTCIHPLERRI
jgi:hypothetical protein